MALLPITELSKAGIIKDIPPYAIVQNGWSDGNNVRFMEDGVQKVEGFKEVLLNCPFTPYHITPYLASDGRYLWVAFGLNKIAVFAGLPSMIWHEVGTGFNADQGEHKWSTVNLNGLLVATNGTDVPYMWPLTEAGLPFVDDVYNQFVPLENWPNATDSCKTIRTWKEFLVGMNYHRENEEPRLVKWSSKAEYGSPPISWDDTKEELDTGEYNLADTPGDLVDGLQLNDSILLYKQDAIYVMAYIGPPQIFSFKLLSSTIGVLAKNCIGAYDTGHFFIGNADCYITNGQSVEALLSDRDRRAMFEDMSGEEFEKSFVAVDYPRNEMLACYPSAGSDFVNRALIWNWKENTISFRDLPNTAFINSGIVDITDNITWDTQVNEWDVEPANWGERNYDSVKKNLVFLDVVNSKIYRDSYGNKEDENNMHSFIERTGYDLGDPSTVKFVRALYPKMQVSGGQSVNIYVGSQMSTEESIVWSAPIQFNPDTQSKVSCRVSGKYFGFKIESSDDIDWAIQGLSFDVEQSGDRGSRIQ